MPRSARVTTIATLPSESPASRWCSRSCSPTRRRTAPRPRPTASGPTGYSPTAAPGVWPGVRPRRSTRPRSRCRRSSAPPLRSAGSASNRMRTASAAPCCRRRPTRRSRDVTPGYVIHATALDNLLNGDGLVRPALLPRTLALLVFATVVGAVFGAIPSLRESSFVALGLAIAYIGAALWVFSSFQLWLLIVTPIVAVAAANLGVTGYGYLTEGRER